MLYTVTYPGTRKQDVTFEDRAEAVQAAYGEADERTVEVYDGSPDDGELLAHYEKRDEPAMPPAAVEEGPVAVSEPGSGEA